MVPLRLGGNTLGSATETGTEKNAEHGVAAALHEDVQGPSAARALDPVGRAIDAAEVLPVKPALPSARFTTHGTSSSGRELLMISHFLHSVLQLEE